MPVTGSGLSDATLPFESAASCAGRSEVALDCGRLPRVTSLPPVVPDRPVDRLLWPFREFARLQVSGGIVLLTCAVIAIAWANSPWSAGYEALWRVKLSVGLGGHVLEESLLHWINDGLMAVFFFVVGLEIKREVLAGELASPRQAALPIAAAIGGMAVPALIYTSFALGTPSISGWGIPMATDIAFALGVLALVGDRVSVGLKVFLTALAIIDDLGAVLVIAIFYTDTISWGLLAAGGAGLGLLAIANVAGVRRPLVYGLVGIVVWLAFLESGVHATVAGVLLAMTIPTRARIDSPSFVAHGQALLDEIDRAVDDTINDEAARYGALEQLEAACEHAESPLHRFERALHPLVTFAIMPIFALANAGVSLGGGTGGPLLGRVTLGVFFGLLIGKQAGVMLASWVTVRLNLASLPAGTTWKDLYGVSWLAGIGFTMSLFIASLAFDDAASLDAAKVGVLAASTVAGLVGFALLRLKS